MERKKLNKILSICFVAILTGCALIGGTMAMTSDDKPMVVSEDTTLSVALVQQQRSFDANGNWVLQPFEDGKALVPLVGSAQYDGSNFDKYGMPKADGYLDNIVRVQNTGNIEAYVRVVAAVPAVLDTENEFGKTALHWNLGNRFMANGDFDNETKNIIENYGQKVKCEFVKTATVGNEKCNIYTFTYKESLPAGQTTELAAFVGFYLDRTVNVVNGHIMMDGVDTGYTNDNVKIYVKAQAVQATGITSEIAFSQSEVKDNPWKTTDVTVESGQSSTDTDADIQ